MGESSCYPSILTLKRGGSNWGWGHNMTLELRPNGGIQSKTCPATPTFYVGMKIWCRKILQINFDNLPSSSLMSSSSQRAKLADNVRKMQNIKKPNRPIFNSTPLSCTMCTHTSDVTLEPHSSDDRAWEHSSNCWWNAQKARIDRLVNVAILFCISGDISCTSLIFRQNKINDS